MEVAEWASTSEGVVALGLAGEERLGTLQYAPGVALAAERRGLPWFPTRARRRGRRRSASAWRSASPAASATACAPIEDPLLVDRPARRGHPAGGLPHQQRRPGRCTPRWRSIPSPPSSTRASRHRQQRRPAHVRHHPLRRVRPRARRRSTSTQDILYTLTMNAVNAALVSDARRAELRTPCERGSPSWSEPDPSGLAEERADAGSGGATAPVNLALPPEWSPPSPLPEAENGYAALMRIVADWPAEGVHPPDLRAPSGGAAGRPRGGGTRLVAVAAHAGQGSGGAGLRALAGSSSRDERVRGVAPLQETRAGFVSAGRVGGAGRTTGRRRSRSPGGCAGPMGRPSRFSLAWRWEGSQEPGAGAGGRVAGGRSAGPHPPRPCPRSPVPG